MPATSVIPLSPKEYPAPTQATSVLSTRTPASRTSFTMSRWRSALISGLGCRADCVHSPISTPFLLA